ncbi:MULTISPECIES: DUF58 domain-containing protein [unclassified Minwuia]|jgi:Protein of unknown function DUF58|uniref:DUF58 domain-containing protein n=1 Tax=unclassified Minwuia TaxID=2618799 RepID=UPI0024789435|nr:MULTISPECIES: DUF58 domain-containing protein [unclassified Minwuia]
MFRPSETLRPETVEQLTLSRLIAMDPFRARRPGEPGNRTPMGVRPGRRGLRTGDMDGLAPYAPGGDIRMIDWRGFARTGQLRQKEREREAHSAVMLVADLGPHMRFGTRDGTLALRAALALAREAWIALRRDEPVGIATSPHGVLMAPARGRRRLLHGLDRLAATFARRVAPAPLSVAVESAAGHLRSADDLRVFSDFHFWLAEGQLPTAGHRRSGRWFAVQVDDAVHQSVPPPGHYPARSMATARMDEDIRIGRDTTGHAAVAAATELNRRLQAEGWRIADPMAGSRHHWSDDA